jgi:type I restriction enzyme S subunit
MFGDPVKNPKGWKRIHLSEILLKIESGHSPVCLDRTAKLGEWGVLKLGAVTKCIYDSAENKALPDIEKPNPDIEIRAGDVLFSRKNTYELVAACAYVWETPPKLMMSDLIFRLVPRDKDSINSIFLQALLSFPSKRKMIQKMAGGAAGSMPNISKAKLLGHRIEVPPYILQNQFAEIVKKTESLKQKMLVQSEELENQFQALMQKAFKGAL